MFKRNAFPDKDNAGKEIVYFTYSFRDELDAVIDLNSSSDSLKDYEGKTMDLEVLIDQSTFGGRTTTKIKPMAPVKLHD